MARGLKALITPEVLRWAREASKLSLQDVASKTKREVEEIGSWEDGSRKPTFAQLRKLATLYKRPVAVFYLPAPPEGFQTLRDFRNLDGHRRQVYSATLDLLIREAKYRQERLKEIVKTEVADPLEFVGSASLGDNPLNIAKKIREALSISYDEQRGFKTTRQAFKAWMERVEQIGIFVFRRRKISLEEARGFVIVDRYAPLIFVNSDDSETGQIFTLAHELAHVWLGLEGVSNMDAPKVSEDLEANRIEVFCNKVASSVLLEQGVFSAEWNTVPKEADIRESIEQIAGRYKVSEEMIARRLLDGGAINKDLYLELREEFKQRFFEAKQKREQRLKNSEGGPSYYRKTASNIGYSLIRTVVAASLSGNISVRDASDILGVKANNMRKLGIEVGLLEA